MWQPRASLARVAARLPARSAGWLLPAAALDFPLLGGRVVDQAGILDQATRAALTEKLAALEAKTTDQLVVVTLKSLQGTSIEEFGVALGRRWQVGQKDKNNGALLIVAPNERKVRIEVGYGLEGALTDAVTRLIIENAIVPRFRAGDFAGGITRGVDDIVSVLTGDAEEWKRRAAQRPDPATGRGLDPDRAAGARRVHVGDPDDGRHHAARSAIPQRRARRIRLGPVLGSGLRRLRRRRLVRRRFLRRRCSPAAAARSAAAARREAGEKPR